MARTRVTLQRLKPLAAADRPVPDPSLRKLRVGRWARISSLMSSSEGAELTAKEQKVMGQVDEQRHVDEYSYLTEMLKAPELRGVLLPFSRARTLWDLLTMLLVVYTALWLPLYFVYDVEVPPAMTAFEMAVDVIFIADIALNFRTAYVTPQATLVVDRKGIAKNYAQKWLPIDVIGSIPWEIIFLCIAVGQGRNPFGPQDELEEGGDQELLSGIRILKLPKLLRLGRFFKMLERFEGGGDTARILLLVVIMAIFVHWISCLWYLVASAEGGGGGSVLSAAEEGWLHSCADGAACVPRGAAWHQIYLPMYYSSLMMVMGDNVAPQRTIEYVFAAGVALLGACMNAVIFANVATLVAQMGEASSRHKLRMDAVMQALRPLKLSPTSRQRVHAYFEYLWVRHRDHTGQQFFEMLPFELRKRITVQAPPPTPNAHWRMPSRSLSGLLCVPSTEQPAPLPSQVHGEKLRAMPLLAEVDGHFLSALSTHLQPEVFLPDEDVIVRGMRTSAAYFIDRGRVRVTLAGRTIVIRTDYFAEHALFLDTQYCYAARAMTHVDAYSLERARFEGTMLQFPSAAVHLADVIATTRSKETPAEKRDKKRRSAELPPERAGLAASPTAEPHGSFDERGASTSIDALREAIDQRFEALEQKLERVLAAVPTGTATTLPIPLKRNPAAVQWGSLGGRHGPPARSV